MQIKVDSNTTAGHPALNQDESLLVFASDLSGGYGGKDLWLTQKEKRNKWSDPINLGPMVNTPGDEMFPFLHTDGVVYFSSNGHIGMGGMDIYKTSQDENGAYILPVNLKAPVNFPTRNIRQNRYGKTDFNMNTRQYRIGIFHLFFRGGCTRRKIMC